MALVLVHRTGAVHVPAGVASRHRAAARADAADRLGVSNDIHRRVRLAAVVARRTRAVVVPNRDRRIGPHPRTTIRTAIPNSTRPPNRSVRIRTVLAASLPNVSPTIDMIKVAQPHTTATVTAEAPTTPRLAPANRLSRLNGSPRIAKGWSRSPASSVRRACTTR